MQRTLDSLNSTLEELEAAVAGGQAEQASILTEIDLRRQETALRQEHVRQYRIESEIIYDSIRVLGDSLVRLEAEIAVIRPQLVELANRQQPLARRFAETLLAERRLSEWASLDFLLGANSWRDLLSRRATLHRLEMTQKNQLQTIADEASLLREAEGKLRERSAHLILTRNQLELKKQAGRELENNLGNELRELQRSRAKLNQKLLDVQRNTQLLELQRQETAQAQSAIQTMIGQVTRGEPVTGIPLSLLKGKLPWPVSGSVVQEFGVVKNKDLATTTDNPGIDISTDADADVRAIAGGSVTSVTWLRGFGNVCIIEHPGTFFSVYARLGHIEVSEGDAIDKQGRIGTAGYDPLADQYKVHFELWSGKEKKNPREWLTNRP